MDEEFGVVKVIVLFVFLTVLAVDDMNTKYREGVAVGKLSVLAPEKANKE